MTQATPIHTYATSSGQHEANSSGVSWSAVIAGAFVTAALSLILLALGAGLGLSSVSPWSNVGASGPTIGKAAIVWLIVLELISSSVGGYLAGRLRTKWTTVHSDEVYFRDTAHGFLAWSTALVVTAAFLASAATAMIGGSTKPESTTQASDSNAYFVNELFRGDNKAEPATPAIHSETAIIFAKGLTQGSLSANDKSYLVKLISAQIGIPTGDADKRVDDTFAEAQQTAEVTRKAVAHSLLWTFLALLIGAFCASFSATIGGRQRDNVVTI
jgi:hypothetical protein